MSMRKERRTQESRWNQADECTDETSTIAFEYDIKESIF